MNVNEINKIEDSFTTTKTPSAFSELNLIRTSDSSSKREKRFFGNGSVDYSQVIGDAQISLSAAFDQGKRPNGCAYRSIADRHEDGLSAEEWNLFFSFFLFIYINIFVYKYINKYVYYIYLYIYIG